ncbi:YbhB/YbcL family Raf kinase inhibitor-like protein [Halobium salinum]|uniref:YbhB/YbcL family Raf kinase inhibitor-like protein n=1 Tax=Halobium salinum TaxID=1364940 RepID=A0ABD5PC24_9EURY|nr:YbhB/YbcL family Raf kinase inhibitor-like protein [Halobium salinum]
MRLTSPAFADGEPIPDRYGYDFENVNPPLAVEEVPADATSLALVVDDPDARESAGKVWDHWVVWNVDPATGDIEAGETPDGAVVGQNSYGAAAYGGPKPPDREHTYRFRLYALDTELALDRGSTKAELQAAMADHVVAETELTGTFAPR